MRKYKKINAGRNEFKKIIAPNKGLEPLTLRLKV